jgi:hypothetical protein
MNMQSARRYAIKGWPWRMLMGALRVLNVAILSVLVGSAALVYAQDEKREEKAARQEEAKPKQDEAKPPKQDEAKPPKQDKQMEKQEPKRGQERAGQPAKPEGQEHPKMQGDRERRAGKGGHIPDDKFRAHFGQSHHFTAKTVIVQGQPQFQYGGYTFELVDVWPVDWAYADDVYLDYIDGEYFLFDLLHPGVRIALIVVM